MLSLQIMRSWFQGLQGIKAYSFTIGKEIFLARKFVLGGALLWED